MLITLSAVVLGFAQTDSLNIYWDQNPESDMSAYRLYRAEDNSNNLQLIQTISYPLTHAVDKNNIVPGALLSYALVAVDSAGNASPFSDVVKVGIPAVQWPQTVIPPGVTTTLQTAETVTDPDNDVADLTVTFNSESHIQIVASGDVMKITPIPADYSGPASFRMRVEDPTGFWDEKLIQVNISNVTDMGPGSQQPVTFEVDQNFPNPFNPTTEIRYSIPKDNVVEVRIYNSLGQQVKTLVSQYQSAGQHNVTWDGTNNFGQKVSSGTYIYIVKSGNYLDRKKMVLLK